MWEVDIRVKGKKWWDYSRGREGLPGKGAAEDLDSDSFIDPEGGQFLCTGQLRTHNYMD